jgi:hypothetical protein
MRLFFHKVIIIFNTLFSSLSKTLCTSVVKFPASTSVHTTETLFQFIIMCKMAPTQCILYRSKQVTVGGCQIWAVSRMGKNSPSHFCDCLTCAQAGVRLGIVVKEKDVFHVSVTMNSADALWQFEVQSSIITSVRLLSAVNAVAGGLLRGLSPVCFIALKIPGPTSPHTHW